MEHGRRKSWTGGPRPQHASADGLFQTLRVTTLAVSPASLSGSHSHTSPKIPSATTFTGSALHGGFAPFLTGSALQTEFAVTHSKQSTGKFLTGARTAIKLAPISALESQKLARVNLRNRYGIHVFCAFLPGSAQNVENDVTYSKQSTGEFLPGATTASNAHGKSSNIDGKISEGRAWLRL